MGITSSLLTALSGLSASQSQIDVVGNNIANVNTTGYKSSSSTFKTQFSQTFSYGSAANSTSGGTNPVQVGLGVQTGAVTKNFNDGTVTATGVASNLAIQGNGFFVLNTGDSQVYTRDGSFILNNNHDLVTTTGDRVEGYGVDADGNIVSGSLTNINIPIGTATTAQSTTSASFTGTLNASGTVASTAANLTSEPLYLSDGAGGVDATNPPTGTTALTNVVDASGNPLFAVGSTINLTATKGTNTVTPQSLTVTSTTTLGDLESFMNGSLGIDTTTGAQGAVAATPGVTLATTGNTASISITGNPGTVNDLTMDTNSITIKNSGTSTTPFTWTKNSSSNGESVTTTVTGYDSLGAPVTVNVSAVLSGTSSAGSTWKVYATSGNGTGTGAAVQTVVGEGTLTFDTAGNLTSTDTPSVTIDRSSSGAENLTFNLSFATTTAMSSSSSALASTHQDGYPSGTLKSYSIGTDGTITGTYSNGMTKTLGQVAIATFTNVDGLVDNANNTYSVGPNSGTAIITAPGSLSAGTLTGGALESSNVDLSTEFVQLISASTAFSANSRVISSSNTLLQDLLSAIR